MPHFYLHFYLCYIFFPYIPPKFMLSVSWTGALPCGGWDCECAFRSQQGCCCVAKPLFELEEATFIRLVGLWEGLSNLNSQIEEVTGSHYNRHLTFTYLRQNIMQIFAEFSLLSVLSSSWMQDSLHCGNATNEWMSWAFHQQHVYLLPVCLTQSREWVQCCIG